MIKKIRGFTLVEIMVVVAIVGILSYFSAKSYSRYVFKQKVLQTRTQLFVQIRNAIETYVQYNGKCPADADIPGLNITWPYGVNVYRLLDNVYDPNRCMIWLCFNYWVNTPGFPPLSFHYLWMYPDWNTSLNTVPKWQCNCYGFDNAGYDDLCPKECLWTFW